MTQLDLNDIQSGVVSLGNMICAQYLMYTAPAIQAALARQRQRGATARKAAQTITNLLTSAADRHLQPHVNVAFTATGLIELGLPVAARAELPPAFVAGSADRAHELGDVADSDPQAWESWTRSEDVAALISITGPNSTCVDDAVARIIGVLGTPTHTQHGHAIDADGLELTGQANATGERESRYEHFGFRDGLSNPVIEGAGRRVRPGDGALRDGRWWPVKPGEFILGYEDETRQIRLGPQLRPYFRNGSYVVWRKLQQDTLGFHRQFVSPKTKASVIGRWPNGSPLATWPDAASPDGHPTENGFTYAADPGGRLCPISAHIRRTNPRDGLDMADVVVNRHRLIRRGVPYTERCVDARSGKGLIFVCYNADIERQFEFVQRRWMGADPFRSPVPTTDPLAGFVTTRASLYLFQPGVLGCERLLSQVS